MKKGVNIIIYHIDIKHPDWSLESLCMGKEEVTEKDLSEWKKIFTVIIIINIITCFTLNRQQNITLISLNWFTTHDQ